MKIVMRFLALLLKVTALIGVLSSAASAQDPMNEGLALIGEESGQALAGPITLTYDVWLSTGDSAPPHEPFHDCLTVDYDGTNLTILLEGCPPAGPAFVGAGVLNYFYGTTCGGANLLGWFLNGTAVGLTGDTIGGVMLRPPKVWGFEGVRNDACQLIQ